MKKTKELYRSKLHTRDKSHDVVIIQDTTRVNGCKLKMTYDCYNANERFTGGNNSHVLVSGLNCGIVVLES